VLHRHLFTLPNACNRQFFKGCTDFAQFANSDTVKIIIESGCGLICCKLTMKAASPGGPLSRPKGVLSSVVAGCTTGMLMKLLQLARPGWVWLLS
jgi:hypothetical protein